MQELEQITFEECGYNKFGIHSKVCYAMFAENQSGMAKMIRALRQYHSPTLTQRKRIEEFDAGESFVGEPHIICECLERLQYLRFQTLCNYKAVFVANPNEQNN